jgi:hypothetical protein
LTLKEITSIFIDKKTQIRGDLLIKRKLFDLSYVNLFKGDKRVNVAKECLLEANGSPFIFVNNKIVDVIRDSNGNDELAILPEQVS